MNLVNAYVTEILGPPKQIYGKWWVPVRYTCYGVIGETEVMCNTKAHADNVAVGYEFDI